MNKIDWFFRCIGINKNIYIGFLNFGIVFAIYLCLCGVFFYKVCRSFGNCFDYFNFWI